VIIRKVMKVLGILILALLLIVAVSLAVFTFSEYRPAEKEIISENAAAEPVFAKDTPLKILSWNCGYGALGDNADFFMDGGKSVYTADRERVSVNLNGIRDKIAAVEPDLMILQEVDINSSRSYNTDERNVLKSALPAYSEAFAYNFNALYIPYPLPPIGHVESGLYTLSRAPASLAERISLPVSFSWPIRLFNLKRCLLVSRFPVKGSDKELVLVNLHLEAYDSGEGKEKQTRQLISFMQDEYAKGNYVIAGGDFNQRFSNIDQSAYPVFKNTWHPGIVDAESFKDFSLLMDNRVPTCRSLDRAYAGADKSSFQFYLIDGFIISSNIRSESVETLDEGFVFSDHNPVCMTFVLQ